MLIYHSYSPITDSLVLLFRISFKDLERELDQFHLCLFSLHNVARISPDNADYCGYSHDSYRFTNGQNDVPNVLRRLVTLIQIAHSVPPVVAAFVK